MAWRWNYMTFKIPSNPSYSLIIRWCLRTASLVKTVGSHLPKNPSFLAPVRKLGIKLLHKVENHSGVQDPLNHNIMNWCRQSLKLKDVFWSWKGEECNWITAATDVQNGFYLLVSQHPFPWDVASGMFSARPFIYSPPISPLLEVHDSLSAGGD